MNNIEYNITELSLEEMSTIDGGHDGFAYKAGEIWMGSMLMVLGTLAGIAEGLNE